MIRDTDYVVGDDDYGFKLPDPDKDTEHGYGLEPRDYQSYPRGCFAAVAAVDVPLIPMEDWPDLIRQRESQKSTLSQLRLQAHNGQPVPSLNQGRWPYCWSHSATSANMLLRMVYNLPYVPLSAFCVAATIKRGASQGGFGAQALDFLRDRGQSSQSVWPQGDANYRRYDTPEVWANAKLHRVTEGFIDLETVHYNRDLSNHQVGSLLLAGVPVILDYNWWRHSVCGMDLVDCYPSRGATDFRRYGVRIWNSWADSYGDRGTTVLKDSKAWPDGSTAPRATVPSVA